MVTIFHLSDLHIATGAHWNNLQQCILDEARRIEGEKILVLTGDFHNYGDGNYDKAKVFLKELFAALGVNPAEDVFAIPGNHDVGNPTTMERRFPGEEWAFRQNSAVEWLKTHNAADQFYSRNVEARLASYAPYCAFVRELGIYPDGGDEYLPARVHVRCWRGRLNILHLNTTLVAAGQAERAEQVDILSATAPEIWKGADGGLPALALGHNSFYDLVNDKGKGQLHQRSLVSPFAKNGVCAYLCGDTHAEEIDSGRQIVRLDYGYSDRVDVIPNAVGVKGAADEKDTFSDFGLYLHEWDEGGGTVRQTLLRWLPDRTQARFFREAAGGYSMPHRSPTDELERLRAQAEPRDEPQPETEAEKERTERARALWTAGQSAQALALLDEGAQALREQARQRIREQRLAIDILKSEAPDPARVAQIRARYEDCARLAMAHRASVSVVYDYVSFLDDQHDYAPAVEAARWLMAYYEQEHEPVGTQAALRNLLGILLAENHRFAEAEAEYRAALALYEKLAKENPSAYEPNVAATRNNLGNLLKNTNRMTEAEAEYRAALALYEKLARENPSAYEPDVATTRNNLGTLLSDTNRIVEAEAEFRAALAIREKLAKENPSAYEPYVATTAFNYALLLLQDQKRGSEAKPLLERAAAIWDEYPHFADRARRAHGLLTLLDRFGLLH